jgi:predicted enzyme related to lactoylglutathione lyase
MANQIVWCDIPVIDLDRAVKFYTAVLGQAVKKQEFSGMTIGILPHRRRSRCVFIYQRGRKTVGKWRNDLLKR